MALSSDSDVEISTGLVPDSGRQRLTILRLVGINAMVCALEFCASASCTYLPPMLLKGGMGETAMSILMGLGPLLAMFSVTYLGRWSDRCHSRLGRRRPFIALTFVLVALGLITLSWAASVSSQRHLEGDLSVSYTGPSRLLLLIVGTVILNYACHAGFNPCQALVSDFVTNTPYSDSGFGIYSCMVSLGGCIGYFITAVDWRHAAILEGQPMLRSSLSQEQAAFLVILVLLCVCMLTTMSNAKEARLYKKPLVTYSAVEDFDQQLAPVSNGVRSAGERRPYNLGATECQIADNNNGIKQKLSHAQTMRLEYDQRDLTDILNRKRKRFTSAIIASKFWNFNVRKIISQNVAACSQYVSQISPSSLLRTTLDGSTGWLRNSPDPLRRLFLVDLLSWSALMCHNIFYTDYVGQVVYGGSPRDVDGSAGQEMYDEGVRMGSWGLLWHSVTACLFAALLQDECIRHVGLRRTYIFGLFTFSVSMFVTWLTSNVVLLNLCAAMSGIGFAAVTTMPNTLVTAYHADPMLYNNMDSSGSRRQNRGLAEDIAVLDVAYYLSQVVPAMALGPFAEWQGNVSVFMLVAAILAAMAMVAAAKLVVYPPKKFPVQCGDVC